MGDYVTGLGATDGATAPPEGASVGYPQGKIEEYIGCDIVQSHLHKVDLLCEATRIPLAAPSFDTVFSSQTIEHVAEHQEMVNEAFQLLKPNGYLILSGPFCWPLHEEPHDFFRFSKYGYAHILTKAGFRVIEIRPNGGMWAATGLLIIETLSNSRRARYWVSRFIAALFFRVRGPYLINKALSTLDERDFNPVHTLNYVAVAQKPEAADGA